jgi:hypothetical protein
MRTRSFCTMTLTVLNVAACAPEPEYTEQQRMCIAQRYQPYDARQLNQCIDVCRNCLSGTAVTCNTSCKMKGAT